jgi:hypothetical protein
MDRTVALRTAGAFALSALVFGVIGAGAPSQLAQALFVMSATAGSVMLAIGLAPRPRLIPLRTRSGGRRTTFR